MKGKRIKNLWQMFAPFLVAILLLTPVSIYSSAMDNSVEAQEEIVIEDEQVPMAGGKFNSDEYIVAVLFTSVVAVSAVCIMIAKQGSMKKKK